MPDSHPSKTARHFRHSLPSRGFALRLAGCFSAVGVGTVFVGLAPEANLIWVANGVLLGYLLLAPRSRWPAYLFSAYLAQFSCGLLIGHHGIATGLLLTLLNIAESLVSALLLRRRFTDLPDFTNPSYITRFLVYGVFAGPAALGAVDAILSPLLHASSPLWNTKAAGMEFLMWVAADSLGACVATPAVVAIFRSRFRRNLFSWKHWAHLVPVLAASFAAFCQNRLPLPFLLYPILVLVLLRLGLGWAALGTLFTAGIASSFTVRREGPFAPSASIAPLESAVLAQLFIAGAMALLYSISVVLENLRTTERHLERMAALHKLVMENSRDVIIVADFDGNRSFVSAAGMRWGGWLQQDLVSHTSLDLVHPDDRAHLAAVIKDLRSGKDGDLVECRVRKRDGNYVWVESSLRTIFDPVTGIPTGVLNNVREITERKIAQQRLAEAYDAAEAMAITDALTGLANRRQFDHVLTSEWLRALREGRMLSLVLMDVDLFKAYNDSYGHLSGDNCLKQIAESARSVVSRPGDLVARFGGEEFAVILPDTPGSGALQIAQNICATVSELQMPHSASLTRVVTLSAGYATVVPQMGQHPEALIEAADRALYRAKRAGRNRVCDNQSGSVIEPQADIVVIRTA